jgi:hypothetical protein
MTDDEAHHRAVQETVNRRMKFVGGMPGGGPLGFASLGYAVEWPPVDQATSTIPTEGAASASGGFDRSAFDSEAFDQPPPAPLNPPTDLKVELNDPLSEVHRKPTKRRSATTRIGKTVLKTPPKSS